MKKNTVFTNTINELTVDAGVTIEGVNFKDGIVSPSDVLLGRTPVVRGSWLSGPNNLSNTTDGDDNTFSKGPACTNLDGGMGQSNVTEGGAWLEIDLGAETFVHSGRYRATICSIGSSGNIAFKTSLNGSTWTSHASDNPGGNCNGCSDNRATVDRSFNVGALARYIGIFCWTNSVGFQAMIQLHTVEAYI